MRQLKINQRITDRSEHTLETYFKEVGKIESISEDDEKKLGQIIQNGTKEEAIEARNKLVSANLRFGVSVAKQYHREGLSLQNLIQEASIGLTKAAERFDPDRNLKFISYAVWWVRQTIIQYLAENSRLVRLPANRLTEASTINKATEELISKLQREPSDEEIVEYIIEKEQPKPRGLFRLKRKNNKKKSTVRTASDVGSAKSDATPSVSIYSPLAADDDESGVINVMTNDNALQPDAALEKEDNEIMAAELLDLVEDFRKRRILELYYGIGNEHGEGLTYEQIANHPDISVGRERVRQLKEEVEEELVNMLVE